MAQTKVKLISDGVIVQGNLHASHGITTAHIGEGSNLYYTDARVGSYLSSNGYATQTDIVAAITDSAPATLDTLNELAAALGDDPNFATTTANSIGLKAPLASPSFTGNATFAGNVNLGDNDKLQLGAGNDLQIYHDGSNSFINDTGTGDLVILSNTVSINNASNSENIAKFLADGPVKLYYDNVQKLQTTSTGIEVSGTSSTFAGNVGIGTGIINPSIGGDIAITQGAIGLRVNDAASAISPTTATANNDNAVDLGVSNIRFRNLYMGGNMSAGRYLNLTNSDYTYIQGTHTGAADGEYCMRVFGYGDSTFYGSLDILRHDTDDGEIRFRTRIAGAATDIMTIADGNVGIGTTGPSNKLDVNGSIRAFSSSYVQVEADQTDSARVRIGVSSGSTEGFLLCNNEGANHVSGNTSLKMLVYNSGGTLIESARFTTDGVGIGTTSPSEIFHVNKNSAGNIVGGYFTNSQANTGAQSVSLAFGLNRSGGDFVRQTKAITFGAEQQWTGTPSTVDGYLAFSTMKDETPSEKARIDSAGAIVIGTGSSNAGFLDFDTTNLQFNTQRNPNTGAFVDTGKSHAHIGLQGSNGGSKIIFGTASANNTTATERARVTPAGNVGIGTTSPGDKLEVSGGNIRITNNSPMLRFRDSDITNLEHRVLGGGNQGLEYSADVNNVTAGYHRWDIANSEKMRLIENGNLGINTTSPDGRLDVRGAISSGMALEDENVSLTSNGGTPQATGTLEISQGWSASTSNGDTIVFRHNSTSWKAWVLHYSFASTNGITVGVIGGYWNNSGSSSNNFIENNLGASVAVTHGGTGNQNIIVTFTFTALGTHPLSSFKYIQHGGDGKPLASKTSITLNS